MHTIFVVGGTGFFGSRICSALATHPNIRLIVAGRDRDKIAAATRALGLAPSQGVALDANSPNLVSVLRQLRVDTIVHTAGPFQQQNYHVASGCNYVDLADGRRFVCDIGSLDADARARGVTVISGASSVPGLSSGVIDRYRAEFLNLESIETGIGSGAPIPGLAAVQGIFSYCGRPIECWEDARWTTYYGWLDIRHHRFPPPVGQRLVGRCDVPDLELFPRRYSSARTVSFHAGFASDAGHLAVWLLSALARRGILKGVGRFARPLTRIGRWMEPFVSDKGGMFVEMAGVGLDHKPRRITWHLLASQNHGPHIPCGAAIALAAKLANGDSLPKGAMPCVGLLSVEEYLAPLRSLDIREIVS